MQQPNPYSGNGRMHAVHRTKVQLLKDEAEALSGAARQIAHRASEVLDKGGKLDMQLQMNFVTSAYARLAKDWGVIEQLQQQGVVAKPPPRV